MPLGTTPVPLHSGQAMPSWATIALRMKALLFGSLFRNSASSSSTLKATISDFGDLRGMTGLAGGGSRALTQNCTGSRRFGEARSAGAGNAWLSGRFDQFPQHLHGRLALR